VSRALALFALLAAAAPASAQPAPWTVAHRVALPLDGRPIDLAPLAGEDPIRIALAGSLSFSVDGSEVDALGATGSRRDVASGPFVVLPPGARVVASDPASHRYELEIPRAPSMPVAFNVAPLAMRHLMTASEARASLTGAIELEVLTPPPAPAAVVTRELEEAPPSGWLGGGLGLTALFGLGFVLARRRRDPVRASLGRARRAARSIAKECAALGPAFDPVAASSERLLEAAARTEMHWRAAQKAIERTRWAASATEERARLHEQAESARERLAGIAARLEQTATALAGRRVESTSALGADALLDELKDDLDAAVSAEDAVARMG